MDNLFQNAVPVWLKDKEKEMHIRAQFKAVFEAKAGKGFTVKLATSGVFHLTVNGKFIAYGPARAGKGHFRVDEWDITRYLKAGKNVVVIEVCGYYAYSFYLQKQPSFLIAEISMENEPVCWTGKHFTVRLNPHYIRKTQRYSFQRPMLEAYRIGVDDSFLTDATFGDGTCAESAGGIFLKRQTPYPQFECTDARQTAAGTITFYTPSALVRDGSATEVNPENLSGFPIEELEVFATDECQKMAFSVPAPSVSAELAENTYALYELPYNATGMLCFKAVCSRPVTLYVMFDEILTDGRVNFVRGGCANVVRFDLSVGAHNLHCFEVYTMKHIQIAACGGDCKIEGLHMVEYKRPPVQNSMDFSAPALKRIAAAAIETFRQGSVDLFTDCPSRERAGWLCDSFFSARTAHRLTGGTDVEKAFLENFLHEETYENLPAGMLPMCYPADHKNGQFIPNWALWLVLQLEEYLNRSGDYQMIADYQNKIFKLFDYFSGFENENGLLEHLDGWVFVEWSKANELVQDVNYPTNMLYAAALAAAGRLYQKPQLLEKAARLREEILHQSFNGRFFRDHAVRENGVLTVRDECTEVCQYYAFFFGIADVEIHKELFDILVRDFGPEREKTKGWPEIYPANAFIGNYLRLEILMRQGHYQKVLDNIVGFFDYMAKRTGTLWENMEAEASCNHCFGSYVICWMHELAQKGFIDTELRQMSG